MLSHIIFGFFIYSQFLTSVISVGLNGSMDGVNLRLGERRYYEIPIDNTPPDVGLYMSFEDPDESVCVYYSFSTKAPSRVINEGILEGNKISRIDPPLKDESNRCGASSTITRGTAGYVCIAVYATTNNANFILDFIQGTNPFMPTNQMRSHVAKRDKNFCKCVGVKLIDMGNKANSLPGHKCGGYTLAECQDECDKYGNGNARCVMCSCKCRGSQHDRLNCP